MQTLAGKALNTKYEATVEDLNTKLQRQQIGVQIGTDGWKRKNVNHAQKIQNFVACFPDSGTAFLGVVNTNGVSMDNTEYERILTIQIESLGKRIGSVDKVLGCITDREAAVQLAFSRLEQKYPHKVNLVSHVGSCHFSAIAATTLQYW